MFVCQGKRSGALQGCNPQGIAWSGGRIARAAPEAGIALGVTVGLDSFALPCLQKTLFMRSFSRIFCLAVCAAASFSGSGGGVSCGLASDNSCR